MEKESSYKNLYKKMDATSKTRFHASRRLKLHAKLSTNVVVIISLGLILISLMQAYKLGNNINSDLVGLIQAFSAIAVLVYSLLIDKNDYSNSSEKMYSCASKVGELKQKLFPLLENQHDETLYNQYRDDYYGILELYETHANNDFRGDYLRAKLEMPENYLIRGKDWWISKIQICAYYILDFFSYPIVVVTLCWILYWLWFGSVPEK